MISLALAFCISGVIAGIVGPFSIWHANKRHRIADFHAKVSDPFAKMKHDHGWPHYDTPEGFAAASKRWRELHY